jgi:hypothetical protein
MNNVPRARHGDESAIATCIDRALEGFVAFENVVDRSMRSGDDQSQVFLASNKRREWQGEEQKRMTAKEQRTPAHAHRSQTRQPYTQSTLVRVRA